MNHQQIDDSVEPISISESDSESILISARKILFLEVTEQKSSIKPIIWCYSSDYMLLLIDTLVQTMLVSGRIIKRTLSIHFYSPYQIHGFYRFLEAQLARL